VNDFYGFTASLLLNMSDARSADIAIRRPEDSDMYASVCIGDLTLLPGRGTDLAAALRTLADRIDSAMTAAVVESKAVA
jgi:hypothetical protein